MKPQQASGFFKAGLYYRLSKEDGIGESSSIKTQREILRDYANKHGFLIFNEYIDDGYTGTNFDRPGFQRLIQDIESGYVNCVITKDLSRLGRNSARVADLLDEYFPSKHVRYISISDNYDSYNPNNGAALTTSIIPAIHELYARDISGKIRSAFSAKMKNGEFIGNFAPYGYKKDVEHGDKNHLVIDMQTAPVVRRMFHLAADGLSPKQIADQFNQDGIVTPAVYRCITRSYLNVDDYSHRKEWTSSMVCKMLRNEVYLGRTLQGKTTKVSFKKKDTLTNPRDEWIVVDCTHEPIISEDLFHLVRNRAVSRRQPPTKGFHNIFSGIAKCADCGRNMTTCPSRKKGVMYNLCCGGYKSYGPKECSNHFISYDDLYSIVLADIRNLLAISPSDREQILQDLAKVDARAKSRQSESAQQELAKARHRIHELETLLKKLYEDYALGRITLDLFTHLSSDYESEHTLLTQTISKSASAPTDEATLSEQYRKFFSLLDDMINVQELSKTLLSKLVDHIEVDQGSFTKDSTGRNVKHQKIRIFYRFVGQIQ